MTKATAWALATVMTLTCAAAAQDWPTRPITLVVPFAAGGPVDVAARLVAPRMSEMLGQQIVVENIGGAGGMTGATRVAKAPPDGYTAPARQRRHPHLQPVALQEAALQLRDATSRRSASWSENTKVLVVRKDFPANTLPEFIAYVKANQAKLQYGSAGVGSATHIACVLLNYRDRHQRHPRALSRRRPGDAGPDRRPHRFHVRHDLDRRCRRFKASR